MLFTTDGGAFGPATIRAGSVGIKKAMANVMTETMNRVKNNQATLRTAYAAVSAPSTSCTSLDTPGTRPDGFESPGYPDF